MIRGMMMVAAACIALCGMSAQGGVTGNDGSFSYQGYLEDNGAPANGMYSFRIEAFDEPAGGSVASEMFFVSGLIPVVDGLFVVDVQMGGNSANADVFWRQVGEDEFYLEIGVGLVEGGPYETLGQRVKVSWGARSQYSARSGSLTFPYTDSFTDEFFNPTTMMSLTSVAGGTVLEANAGVNDDPAIITVNSATPNGVNFGPQTGGVHIDAADRQIGLISISDEFAVAGLLMSDSGVQDSAILGQVNGGVTDANAVFALNFDAGTRAYLGTPEYAGLFEGDTHTTGQVTRDYSGGQSPVGPLAYGSVSAAGNVTAGTANLTASWNQTSSRYEIVVTGESIAFNTHSVTVTVVDSNEPRLATINTVNGDIRVHIWDLNSGNIAVQDNFSIVIHDSNPVVVSTLRLPEGVDADKYAETTGANLVETRSKVDGVGRVESRGISVE